MEKITEIRKHQRPGKVVQIQIDIDQSEAILSSANQTLEAQNLNSV